MKNRICENILWSQHVIGNIDHANDILSSSYSQTPQEFQSLQSVPVSEQLGHVPWLGSS